ncbi:p53-induced death domain-containing protein 1 [Bombina bombina]|uniref:p53-induced death domain-containing protein 1 n=1 Tax=Bombina bombina TaxID=8345 RepID=UPI00235A99AB|nr:p53-induced death domain-containing protein 1 [Bombina bombina]
MEPLLDPPWEGTNTKETASSELYLAGKKLNLYVYPDGCKRFLQLTDEQSPQLLQVELIRLCSNDILITQAVSTLPIFRGLQYLLLRGEQRQNETGEICHGLLTTLPSELGNLSNLLHLDLSYNNFTELPPCVTSLSRLSELIISFNQLNTLPDAITELENLKVLSVMSNQLTQLPLAIGQLKNLERLYLSENKLESLPQDIGELQRCIELDISGNNLRRLPETICHLLAIKKLYLCSNSLVAVPESLGRLPHLLLLDLRNNHLRCVTDEIRKFGRLEGNPIGLPEPSSSDEDDVSKLELTELRLNAGQSSFSVTPAGCRVFIPRGPNLYFPPGAVSFTVTIHFQILPPDSQQVRLGHHDVVLSNILELQPHGMLFHQDVEICIPYITPRARQREEREVVIRTFDGQTWTDLFNKTPATGGNERQASCKVSHFSWFLVVSRLVEDRCQVPKEGMRLFSSVNNSIRVDFPEGSTVETRTVSMQVLPVSDSELHEIIGDSEPIVSPLLCLSQSSAANFLSPVKIQLPLPSGITGDTLKHSHLHLLHGDPQAQIWTDITNQVFLETTHIYARFQVNHFSWYWLWYTTKTYVEDVAKKVYKRLRMYQVNFVALQRKRDPEQVLLQCVPKHKVDATVKRLQERYKGPEPSDLIELVEGENFFAAFEQGLQLHSDRPDCVEGRLSFIFYSRMKNIKEVYVTSSADRKERDVKGQVSFYRGPVPEGLPEEVRTHRRGPDSDWMATLPIKLPKLKGKNGVYEPGSNGRSLPPLNLGNAETGYLTETNLLSIARRIGADWRTIGMNLGLSYNDLERIGYNNREDLDKQILDMLFSWARVNCDQQDCIERLVHAMQESNRQDIAEEIQAVVTLGKQKYSKSIRRLGLDQGNSSEDSAIAMSQS